MAILDFPATELYQLNLNIFHPDLKWNALLCGLYFKTISF
jgi:hypothetical protein